MAEKVQRLQAEINARAWEAAKLRYELCKLAIAEGRGPRLADMAGKYPGLGDHSFEEIEAILALPWPPSTPTEAPK